MELLKACLSVADAVDEIVVVGGSDIADVDDVTVVVGKFVVDVADATVAVG